MGFLSRIREQKIPGNHEKIPELFPARKLSFNRRHPSAGISEQSMGARNRVETRLSCRSARYIGWRIKFLGIDSWAPQKFKNTVSGFLAADGDHTFKRMYQILLGTANCTTYTEF
jgi:hypothetical protein